MIPTESIFPSKVEENSSRQVPDTTFCQYFENTRGGFCNKFSIAETEPQNGYFYCEKLNLVFDIREIWDYECVLSFISILFLIIFLVKNANKKNLEHLPHKILYSYSVMLILLYVSFIAKNLTELCIIWHIRKILRISYCLWAIIMSFEFWRVTYASLKNRRLSTKGQTERYLIYCFIGYVLPVLCSIIFCISKLHEMSNCIGVVGYTSLPCPDVEAAHVYKIWTEVRLVVFTILALILILQACVFVYFSKFRKVNSNVNRKHLWILIKMAYMMGIYWMVYVYLFRYIPDKKSQTYKNIRRVVDTMFLYPHGVLMYLAFSSERYSLSKILADSKSTLVAGFNLVCQPTSIHEGQVIEFSNLQQEESFGNSSQTVESSICDKVCQV